MRRFMVRGNTIKVVAKQPDILSIGIGHHVDRDVVVVVPVILLTLLGLIEMSQAAILLKDPRNLGKILFEPLKSANEVHARIGLTR